MIVKQKNLRVFHITVEDEKSFALYIEKNKIILMEFFLLVDGEVSGAVTKILDDEGLCYKDISTCKLRFSGVKRELEVPNVAKKDVLEEPVLKEKLKIYDRPIRSGEEINEELPVVVFGRINSGAKLFSSQSVSIYGIIDGLVQCDGDYIVLNGIGNMGNLIYNGEIIDRDILKKDVLQKITIVNSKIVVKEV